MQTKALQRQSNTKQRANIDSGNSGNGQCMRLMNFEPGLEGCRIDNGNHKTELHREANSPAKSASVSNPAAEDL